MAPPPKPADEVKNLGPTHKILKWWSQVDAPTFWAERYSIYEQYADPFGGSAFQEIGPDRFGIPHLRVGWERMIEAVWDLLP